MSSSYKNSGNWAEDSTLAEKCGLLADLVPQIYDSGHLAQCLKQKAGKQDLVCHIKGKEGTSVLRDTLAPLCKYHEIEVYENQPVKIENQDHQISMPERYLPARLLSGVFWIHGSKNSRKVETGNAML